MSAPAASLYDVIVIGTGPIGQPVAHRARAAGLSVAAVERERVGGECSDWACIPSKAMLRPVVAVADARRVAGARQAVTGPVTVTLEKGGAVEADEVLFATGRRPLTDDIGLDTVGLEHGSWLEVDDTCMVRAFQDGWLYALGDDNHHVLLTHQGKYQARIAGAAIAARADGYTGRAYGRRRGPRLSAWGHLRRPRRGRADPLGHHRRGRPGPVSRLWHAVPCSPISEVWLRLLEAYRNLAMPSATSPASTTEGVTMSNHFSAANLQHPGDDARLDLTDLFVFAAPDDPDRTVLIMDSNPFTKGDGFHPDAVYRFNIDNDGDALPDVAFSFTFSELRDGRQTATACYATGSEAQTREPRGEILIEATTVGFDGTATPVQAGPCWLFIGKRSDPFFADAEGVLHWLVGGQAGDFEWTGTDTFAAANILSIVLEVPNDMLGPGPLIGAWISVSLRRDGMLVQMDRGGNPSFNPILNPNDIKDEFNATDPVDDVKNYLQPLSEALQQHGYPPDEATAAARTLLPDILHYDRTRPASYPNGRVMTDDVFSARMAFMTHGRATPQGVRPHDDMTAAFPFLGPPNP